MAGWTTLRVAHAPTHRPSAAHKLHRAPPQEMPKNKKYKQYPARRSGIAGPTTSAKEAANQPPTLIPTISSAQPSTKPQIGHVPEITGHVRRNTQLILHALVCGEQNIESVLCESKQLSILDAGPTLPLHCAAGVADK